MTAREAEIIELIRKEVKPALGCTEPIAVALAVAKAMEIAGQHCHPSDTDWRVKEGYSLLIEVSGNILKNGMGVGIPGTGMVGLHIAAALGAVCGKSCYGLEVLHDLDAYAVADNLAVDLGITKTVTENGEQVTYKLLWSPFNYGVESKVNLHTYNGKPIDEDYYISNCMKNLGMRLAWGDLAERTEFNTKDYANSDITAKYNYNNSLSTDLDTRDLKPEDDIVQQNWPSGWSIPTAKDFNQLVENTIVTKETIDGHTWFRFTSKINGNSILIPGTGYIDDKPNTEKWDTSTYLQSSTIGTSSNSVSGTTNLKRTIYALNISGTAAKLQSTAGRATGMMIRPVKYVRVQQQ